MTKDQKTYRNTLEIPKPIVYTAKTLQFISPLLASKFAGSLFMSPIKHKMPKREYSMDQHTIQTQVKIPSINKEVVVYEYGKSTKKALLVHGWSGRGTQLFKIADELLKQGYMTISFDAPAHGKAPGSKTNMSEFIDVVLHLTKLYGPFDIGIGHSLGGMTLLNSISQGLHLKKLVIIGCGDKIIDIALDFTRKLGLKDHVGMKMKKQFDQVLGEDINNLSASKAADHVSTPTLIIHDQNDLDVPLSSAENIHKHLQNSDLIVTNGLGHRRILGNDEVITQISKFIQ
ncbi:Pimeloyl-ACP methyl ester carboxylesterase [Zhouia amylolytica]|uniref:Pimeloyl-ACP methyl ester carboxylesterase n=2 Tax=Zhouia amylolytica TaxID=376730 RepID=A0A1I6V7X4_9FLAO|nr:alpha/beta hydrolase [Zhouia amylolytica]ETN96552.1 putative hydrolase or acyltransferase of alpha/beta superfamily [Zhouia amylolytica AD3]SFT09843.1 Pimeloyl-ACP methyl ester carboxylesterase [Zhouia amylolytica]